MPGLSRALEPAQGVQGGVWTAFASACDKEGFVFWTLKTRKIRDVNTGLPSLCHARHVKRKVDVTT